MVFAFELLSSKPVSINAVRFGVMKDAESPEAACYEDTENIREFGDSPLS